MKLAEALAARKDAFTNTREDFDSRYFETLIYEEGDPADDESAYAFLDRLDEKYDEIANLSVAINRTNNEHAIEFDGASLTVMEAVCLRAALFSKTHAFNRILEGIASHCNKRGYRSKDDVRYFTVISMSELRDRKNRYEAELRRLDTAIQSANWTVDLLE